jgi:hypothetical protein
VAVGDHARLCASGHQHAGAKGQSKNTGRPMGKNVFHGWFFLIKRRLWVTCISDQKYSHTEKMNTKKHVIFQFHEKSVIFKKRRPDVRHTPALVT